MWKITLVFLAGITTNVEVYILNDTHKRKKGMVGFSKKVALRFWLICFLTLCGAWMVSAEESKIKPSGETTNMDVENKLLLEIVVKLLDSFTVDTESVSGKMLDDKLNNAQKNIIAEIESSMTDKITHEICLHCGKQIIIFRGVEYELFITNQYNMPIKLGYHECNW